ncbi:hypothetical protein LCGC14_0702030 [marine sediment metagenome]|uniref:Uncharacterized protein n=1 Tax=marine sediment metagenome TaxID=412755 RepID=A0A0F9T3C3_9ZZZZ
MTDQIAERLRLRHTHPVSKKVDKLYDLADKLGISFHFGNVMSIEVRDDDTEYLIEDLEGPSGSQEANPGSFPPCLEWKITTENPKFVEAERRLNEGYVKAEEERRAKVEAECKAVETERRKAEAERVKKSDLKELARLKRKYKK